MGDSYCRYSRSDVGRSGKRRPGQRHCRWGDSRSRPDCRPDFHRGVRRIPANDIAYGSAEDARVDALLARAVAGTAALRTCFVRRTCPDRDKAAAPTQAARSATAEAREAAPSPARIISCGNAFSCHRYSTAILRPTRQLTLRLREADCSPDSPAALADPRAPPHPPALRTTHRTCSARRNSRARPDP